MTGARRVTRRANAPAYARLVQAVRDGHHWTQKQLAIELDVRANTISNWERGITGPRPAEMRLLRALLDNSRQFGVTTVQEDKIEHDLTTKRPNAV